MQPADHPLTLTLAFTEARGERQKEGAETMARQCYQIPITWRREGPKEVYLRPEGSACTAEKVEVYRGYIGDQVTAFIAVWYDEEGRWWNKRFTGRRLERELPQFLAEIQAESGYIRQTQKGVG